MNDYLAVPKERFMRLTRDVLDKTLIDAKGSKVGKIEDIVIEKVSTGENPSIEGIIANKKYIPWKDIAGISEYIVLNRRFFNIPFYNLDAGNMILSKQILDEQLIDETGSKIGRIDDLAMLYSSEEKRLRIAGICTGVHVRVGINKYFDTIPWSSVMGFQKKPRSFIINTLEKRPLSMMNKVVVTTVR